MERKLQERMVGAGVLILALVLVGPLILDGGPGNADEQAPAPGQRPDEIRTQTFRLGSPQLPQTPVTVVPPAPAAGHADGVAEGPADMGGPEATPAAPAPSSAAGPIAAVPADPLEAAPPPPPARASVPGPAEQRPMPPVAPAARTVTGGFLVQVGTFGQKDNADRLTASLKDRNFEAFVSPVSRGDKTLYRVRVGPAGSRDAATSLASRLKAAGQSGQVVAQ